MNPFFTQAFREAAPYIHYLRGKTLVIGLSSTLLAPDVLPNLAADLNLMAALGIRLVLVYDADVQIAALCRQTGYEPRRVSAPARFDTGRRPNLWDGRAKSAAAGSPGGCADFGRKGRCSCSG